MKVSTYITIILVAWLILAAKANTCPGECGSGSSNYCTSSCSSNCGGCLGKQCK